MAPIPTILAEPFLMVNNRHTTRPGFSILELMVVMMLIGVMTAAVGPFLFRRPTARDLKQVAAEINNLAGLATQTAMLKSHVCRLTIERRPAGGVVTVEQESSTPQAATEKGTITIGQTDPTKFELVEPGSTGNRYELPKNIVIEHIKLAKKQSESEEKASVFRCYVMPHGLFQSIEIDLRNETERMHLVMDPFMGRFKASTTRATP